MKKKPLFIVAILTAAGLIGSLGVRIDKVHAVHAQTAAPVGHVAFTAEVLDTVYKPSGEVAMTIATTVAVASNGSEAKVRYFTTPNGQRSQTRSVFDTSKKVQVLINDLARMKSTTPVSDADVQTATTTTCTVDPNAESTQVAGFRVLKAPPLQVTRVGGGVSRLERWLSPELGCRSLKEVHYSSNALSSVRAVQSITLGEPDPALFDVPQGYTESAPSQQIAQHRRLLGRADATAGPNCATCGNGILDRIYSEKRQAQ